MVVVRRAAVRIGGSGSSIVPIVVVVVVMVVVAMVRRLGGCSLGVGRAVRQERRLGDTSRAVPVVVMRLTCCCGSGRR